MKINCKVVIACLVLSSPLVLGGCNTTAGFGKDMQAGGRDIQNAATDGKSSNSNSSSSSSSKKTNNNGTTTTTTKTTNTTTNNTADTTAQ